MACEDMPMTAATLFLVQPVLMRLARSGGSLADQDVCPTGRRGCLPHQPSRISAPPAWSIAGLVLLQFLVGIYGGYFGAGIGILMLSGLGLMGFRDIHTWFLVSPRGVRQMPALCGNLAQGGPWRRGTRRNLSASQDDRRRTLPAFGFVRSPAPCAYALFPAARNSTQLRAGFDRRSATAKKGLVF
jgi:hypothetical protein